MSGDEKKPFDWGQATADALNRHTSTPEFKRKYLESLLVLGTNTPVEEADLKALVALRNQAATKLGFADYHKMQLYLNEQSQEQVLTLFDELDDLTREPFRKLKSEVDAKLFAKQIVAKGWTASAGTLNPHQPKQVVGPGDVERWADPGLGG